MGGALHLLDGAVPPFWAVIVRLVDKFRASGWLSRVCAGRVGGASPILKRARDAGKVGTPHVVHGTVDPRWGEGNPPRLLGRGW